MVAVLMIHIYMLYALHCKFILSSQGYLVHSVLFIILANK